MRGIRLRNRIGLDSRLLGELKESQSRKDDSEERDGP